MCADRSLSEYDIAAEKGVLNVLEVEGVAFRNELHYRLERPAVYQVGVPLLLHNTIDAAINRLKEKGEIVVTDLRGRKRKTTTGRKPLLFYRLSSMPYSKPIQDSIKEKRDCSTFLLALSSYAGFYAQKLWVDVFRKLDFNILGEDMGVSEDNTSSVEGDIDIIVERDGVRFGVEVKNGLSYPTDIRRKFRIAVELETIPFFVARALSYGDRKWLPANGGLMKLYDVSIYSPDCPKKLQECMDVLGYPIFVTEKIDDHVVKHLESVVSLGFTKREEYVEKIKGYLEYP